MIVRLLKAWRPAIGWPTFITVLAAGACFPLAIHAGEWVRGSAVLVGLGLAGGIVGGWLAGRRPSTRSGWRWRDRTVWSLGFVVGGVATFVVIGRTLPSIALLFQAYGSAEVPPVDSGLVSQLARIAELLARVLWIYWREAALRSLTFVMQITRWVQVALAGGMSRDNDIFLLWTGWLSWAAAFHVMAAFTRKRHPVLTLAPLGLVVTVAEAADAGGDGWLYAFLGLGTILWSLGTYLQSEHRWVRQRTDYPPEIRVDVAMAGFLLAIMVAGTAFTVVWSLPRVGTITSARLSASLRRPLAGPTQRVSETLDRLFGGVRRPPTVGATWVQADLADLPLTRVLAGPPELRDDPVLRVTVAAGREIGVSPLYWRGLTYDEYTGRGWANSTSETVSRPPQLTQVAYLGPELTQQVKMLTDADPVRYAAARPIRVDVGATWITRDGADLVGWYAEAAGYTAVSRPTMASVEELRGASSDYPAWVLDRYLQLPVDLPARVRQRAQEIVGDAGTAYDKAAAIEAAMRVITYSLEVGLPPADRDVVDYFLFDMDAGYCDYFATTMTVLARAVGVPARMATGYATGTYDPELGFYVVRGLDAHAWVEVYFPDIGWVPFEPTPARATLERSPAPPLVSTTGERALNVRIGRVELGRPVFVLIALVVAGGLALWAVRRRQAGQLSPEERVRAAYDAVWRRAGWFGWNGRVSQTPWERFEALQDALARRSVEVTLGDRRFIWRGADAVEDLRQLGLLFVKAQYSRQGVTPEEAQVAWEAGRRVQRRVVLLWRRDA
ncbi:MAG: transglutaminase domain-containing protein [Anaerolineae bacterium]